MTHTELDHTDLEETMRMFTDITQGLKSGYAALSERAERVERELMLANAELEQKVQELGEVKGHLEAIQQALPMGVVVRDEAGRVTDVNTAARSITGADTPASVDSVLLGAGSSEGDTRDSFELARPDGQHRVLSSDSSPVFDADGTLLGSVQILADRTEMTRLTERLHAVDKLAALGTMAGGIAHEIRNPLNAVQGFASLLAKDLTEGSRAHEFADRIVRGSEEANAIIRSLLSFARPEKLSLEPVRGDELVTGAVQAAGSDEVEHPWNIDCHGDAVRFLGDRIKLRQAIRNLVANAMDAQPDGGRVSVQLTAAGDEVVVRVGDAGPGIAPDLRHRILDPFFTTRAEGTGLGLALTQTIAQLHGGRVEISSEASSLGGAEFLIRFPLIPCNG